MFTYTVFRTSWKNQDTVQIKATGVFCKTLSLHDILYIGMQFILRFAYDFKWKKKIYICFRSLLPLVFHDNKTKREIVQT